MSQEAGDIAAGQDLSAEMPEGVLGDGETVILMTRPSVWFVLLESLPVLAAAFLVALSLVVAAKGFHVDIPGRLRYLVPACLVVMLMRLYIASFQWMRRIYILTNRRVLRMRGLIRTEIFECPLENMSGASLSVSRSQRFCHTATVLFDIPTLETEAGAWHHVPRPSDVIELVSDAIRRARH
jgi:hypothetical protein